MAAMSVIGIDFGNESCYIAVAKAGGIETIANDYSLRNTPSCVAFSPKNRILGVAAKNQMVTNMKNTVFGFKRLLGRKYSDPHVQKELKHFPFKVEERADGGIGIRVNYLGEDNVFTPEQMTAMLFTKLKDSAETALQTPINDCVISVPSYFTNAERSALLDAAAISGLNVLRLMNETTATALAYGIYKQDLPAPEDKPKNVVFVDFGHSSLQVAACAFNKGKLRVLANAMDAHCGGRDIDLALADHFTQEFVSKYKLDAKKNQRLTTKPLRKPQPNNADAGENSVRELAVIPSADKHSDDSLSVSEDEHVAPRDAPPHPTGVKLTRPGYYTKPSLDEMLGYIRADGRCVVPNLTIGRKNYGNVYYDCEIDVTGLDLDELVHFLNKEVIIYPEDNDKPPVGEGLNRRAIVTLDRIWPRDKTDLRPITSPDRLMKMDYEGKLRRVCDKHDTKFIEYRPQTGSWVFRVEHFSKYGLTDSDEEDEITPEIMKKQLVNQQLQKSAPIPPTPPAALESGGLGGLGGLGSIPARLTRPPGTMGPGFDAGADFTGLGLEDMMNGSKAYEMDTTDNEEVHSMYTDMERAFGVKSPTTELARLEHRESRNVQLMKASLYADTEMEDDVSVSTADQRVPTVGSVPASPPTLRPQVDTSMEVVSGPVIETQEQPMKPLILHPQTVVLQYHRKIPPFSKTIAGRLDAQYIADMSIARARHSRVGFGAGNTMAYVTTHDALHSLDKKAELCDISRYLSGRSEDDWSQYVVNTLAISDEGTRETLSRHLDALLKNSEATTTGRPCPLYSVKDRLSLLRTHVQISAKNQEFRQDFGVSGEYWHEVWTLCDVLWGPDLENDGIQSNTEEAIVSRYKSFLLWLQRSVAEITDSELKKPTQPSEIDETDNHSYQVWMLLIGGRVLEACKLCIKHQDYNMAAIISQHASDPNFRALLSRQLSQWESLGALQLVSGYKLCVLKCMSGSAPPEVADVSFLQALAVCARYICPQVPTLEQIVETYEQLCKSPAEREVELPSVEKPRLQFPSPPHEGDEEVIQQGEGKLRRTLDLRYLLIRCRALNQRPRLQPCTYTPDPLDYSLCFLLSVWFGSPTADIVSSFASQLEAGGLWHYAVMALCYMPDDNLRTHLIKGVLSCHAPAKADTEDLQNRLSFLRTLGIPEKWLLIAQAHRAKYQHLDLLEAEHLVGAEEWNAAHKVLMDKLLPEAVLKDDLKSIAPLLEDLKEAASKDLVSGWETGGKALYYYAKLCEEIRGLVSDAESNQGSHETINARMLVLRPYIVATCNSLAHRSPRNPREAAALTEMGSRVLRLCGHCGAGAGALAALRQLRVPPDVAASAQEQITTELAEQASELCIQQTADSSPISSHHRSTLQA